MTDKCESGVVAPWHGRPRKAPRWPGGGARRPRDRQEGMPGRPGRAPERHNNLYAGSASQARQPELKLRPAKTLTSSDAAPHRGPGRHQIVVR